LTKGKFIRFDQRLICINVLNLFIQEFKHKEGEKHHYQGDTHQVEFIHIKFLLKKVPKSYQVNVLSLVQRKLYC
jgi:hypothetical protein